MFVMTAFPSDNHLLLVDRQEGRGSKTIGRIEDAKVSSPPLYMGIFFVDAI